MKYIIFILVLGFQRNDFFEILLDDAEQPYKLNNTRQAVASLTRILNKPLTLHEKNNLWSAFKNGKTPQQLTVNELRGATYLLSAAPEQDLYDLNLSDMNIVQVLLRVEDFSRSQIIAIANSLKNHWGIQRLIQADYINKIRHILCGFSERELEEIPPEDLKTINSDVFKNLNTCNDAQLKILYNHAVLTFGRPRMWSRDVVKHVGMIILALPESDLRSLRPQAVNGLNLDILLKGRPELLHVLTEQQVEALNDASKMLLHKNLTFLKSQSIKSTTHKICLLTAVFVQAYLLLKC